MLVAAVFVDQHDLVHAQDGALDEGEIEEKIATRATASTSKVGLFLLVFLLVLREGVETVLILSAVSLNSTELLSFTGTTAGNCGGGGVWRAVHSRQREDQPAAVFPGDDVSFCISSRFSWWSAGCTS